MTATRWWWVRHAPVTATDGRIYGQTDPPCDLDDRASFAGLAAFLPRDAVLVTSPLQRTTQTAAAIAAAGLPLSPALIEPELIEQDFGAWTGQKRAEVMRELGPGHSFWRNLGQARPPGGETFAELVGRAAPAIRRLSTNHAGRDIVSVSHGGVIRAALCLALGLEPARGLTFAIGNCSLTRLDHIVPRAGDEQWAVVCVNRLFGSPPKA